MITSQQVKEIAEAHIAGTDKFIVDVQVKPGNRILVELDGDFGITIADCALLNRHIENALDRSVGDFDLRVSSPGLDRPLKVQRQFVKAIGKKVEVLLRDGRKLEGRLAKLEDNGLKIELKNAEAQSFRFSEIKETKKVISFNR